MAGCLVLSHGQIANAMVAASFKIAGECEQVYTLEADDMTPGKLQEEIRNLIRTKELDKEGLFILVCLRGGSFWNAAARVAAEHLNVQVISGLNLSILLSFITKQHKFTFEELGQVMLNDGKRGVTRLEINRS